MTVCVLVAATGVMFLAGVTENYFIQKVYLTKEDIATHFEKFKLTPKEKDFKSEMRIIVNDLSSIPFVKASEIQTLRNDLLNSKNDSDELLLKALKETEFVEYRALKKLHEIFMFLLVLSATSSFFGVVTLYFFLRRQIFSEMEIISKELSNLNFSNAHKLQAKKHESIESSRLRNSFNTLISHVEVHRNILEAYMKSDDFEALTQNLYAEIKRLFKNVNRLVITKVFEDEMVIEMSLGDSSILLLNEEFSHRVDPSFINRLKKMGHLVVNDVEEYLKKHRKSILDHVYVEEIKSVLMIPISVKDNNYEEDGILFVASFEKHAFSPNETMELKNIVNTMECLYGKVIKMKKFVLSTVRSFTEMVERKDEETGNHTLRVAVYAREIAKELAKNPKYRSKLNTRYVIEIYEFAPLHDIGKVGVPDDILRKPGKLSDEEFEIMKTHTVIGYEILEHLDKGSNSNFFEVAKKIVRHHHERWDGKGYPDGLKGNEIPICARIVTVADVFDALTSKRPYKEAFDFEKAVRIIVEESGSHFDPEVVEAFIQAQGQIRNFYERLSNN